MTDQQIRGRVFITGGTKGIGKAVAEKFASQGYSLLLTYASDDATARNVMEYLINRYNIDVEIFKADITDVASIQPLAAHISESNAPVGAIIFNAAITDRTPFPHITPEGWNSVLQANINFPLFLLEAIDPILQPHSSITFTGSAMGIHPHSVSLAYGVTKEATHSMVKNLVKFYAERRIRVNAIAPGFVNTEWQKTKPSDIRQSIESKIALGHFCQPEDLAQLYWTVVTNPYLNGAIISADGGYNYK